PSSSSFCHVSCLLLLRPLVPRDLLPLLLPLLPLPRFLPFPTRPSSDLSLHPLRPLPQCLPHLSTVESRGGFAAWPHPADVPRLSRRTHRPGSCGSAHQRWVRRAHRKVS